MTEELVWMAGFFDGEGHVGIYSTGGTLMFRITVTQKQVTHLELFKERFGGSMVEGDSAGPTV